MVIGFLNAHHMAKRSKWLVTGFLSAVVRFQYMIFYDAFIGFGWSLASSSNCLILSDELYINVAL